MDATAKLGVIVQRLSPDALRVLLFVAKRLDMGREQYGPLRLTDDGRDFRRERDEEAADLLVYAACEALKGGGPPPRPGSDQ